MTPPTYVDPTAAQKQLIMTTYAMTAPEVDTLVAMAKTDLQKATELIARLLGALAACLSMRTAPATTPSANAQATTDCPDCG